MNENYIGINDKPLVYSWNMFIYSWSTFIYFWNMFIFLGIFLFILGMFLFIILAGKVPLTKCVKQLIMLKEYHLKVSILP